MRKLIASAFLITLALPVTGAEFSNISLSDWNKEELASDHLRFTHLQKKELSIHIQVDSFDKNNFWNEKTLKEDIEKMSFMRNKISSFLGTSDYTITSYKFEGALKTSGHPKLFLTGSYRRIDGQLILFSEINFYHAEHFLQLKIISEGNLPTANELERIIKEINPYSVEID